MRRLACVEILAVILAAIYLQGCAGLSQQYKASTEGIKIVYSPKENENLPNKTIKLAVFDERTNKDPIGDGAKPTIGTKVAGFIGFGVLYLFAPDTPTIQEHSGVPGMFHRAYTERLTKNGMRILLDNTADYNLDIFIRTINLDFNLGTWTGEVGYKANINKDSIILCEQLVFVKEKNWNWYGFGSGETAISNAFNNAINKFELINCFSKK